MRNKYLKIAMTDTTPNPIMKFLPTLFSCEYDSFNENNIAMINTQPKILSVNIIIPLFLSLILFCLYTSARDVLTNNHIADLCYYL